MSELEPASVEVDSAALARSIANVVAFVPAACVFPWVRISLDPMWLELTGGDLYAFGSERMRCEALEGPFPALKAILTRSDAQELEKCARSDKKGSGTLRLIGPGPTGDWYLTFRPETEAAREALSVNGVFTAPAYGMNDLKSGPTVKGDETSAFVPAAYFNRVDEFMQRFRPEPWPVPGPIAFEPTLLSRFGKVKRPDGEPTIMDCWITAPDEPIIVKIGPSFTGALMPVMREVYDNNNPDAEGTWEPL